MKKAILILIILFIGLVPCKRSFGAGFALYEFSSRGNALGGAMIGRADDPSALAYNPAGITQLEESQWLFGFTAIMPSTVGIFQDSGISYELEDMLFLVPHFYYSAPLNDELWWGLGTFSRFGLGTEFDENWEGRYNSYLAGIKSVSVNPSLAWKLTDQLSFAAGLELMWFQLELKKKVDPTGGLAPDTFTDIDARIKGDDIGWGWNLGMHFQPAEKVKLGLSYRSTVDLEVEGNARFYKPEILELPGNFFPDTGAGGEVTLPEMYMAGVCYDFSNRTSIEFDVVRTMWSSYDNLTIAFDDPLNPLDPTSNIQSSEKNWKDTWRYQVGLEHKLKNDWTIRLGYIFDESPIPDETVDFIAPTSDRNLYSIGTEYKKGDWTFDLSYIYIDMDNRFVSAEGREGEGLADAVFTDSRTHLVGLTLNYRF